MEVDGDDRTVTVSLPQTTKSNTTKHIALNILETFVAYHVKPLSTKRGQYMVVSYAVSLM